MGSVAAMPQGRTTTSEPWMSTKALGHVLVLAFVVCAAVAVTVLGLFGGCRSPTALPSASAATCRSTSGCGHRGAWG